MLLAKTFTVPVEPVVKPASDVTTSQKPFFDPGATTSSLAVEKTGPCLDQATCEAVDEMQTATQPLETPGAGIATQPVQPPVRSLRFSPPVRETRVQHLIVKLTSSVLPVPWVMRPAGTGQQTEMSPEMSLTLNLLRRPTTGKL